ncbi:MAG: hypothetical protein JWN14_3842 [Chthonomonadales bacterium]|nr:hypothetical protein [Chthonomonadales bacterium]
MLPGTLDEIDRLLAKGAVERRKYRRRRDLIWLSFIVLCLFIASSYSAPINFDGLFAMRIIELTLLCAYYAWGLYFTVGKQSQSYRAILHRLAELPDPRALGFLMESLNYIGTGTGATVRGAITKILDSLQPEDVGTLPDEGETLLIKYVTRVYVSSDTVRNPDFYNSAIRALCLVGGSTSLSELDRLAKRKPRNDVQRLFQAALLENAPVLRSRLDNSNMSQMLLRASKPSDDTLLHPTQAPTSNPPDATLLLASQAQEKEN